MSGRSAPARSSQQPIRWQAVLVHLAALGMAHIGVFADHAADHNFDEWCYRVPSLTRAENSAQRLSCGRCTGLLPDTGCYSSADCPNGESCSGADEETVWYDARTDGAVNDLKAIGTAQDEFAVYFIVEFWDFADPLSIPFLQLAIDSQAGGSHALFDPGGIVISTGTCSVSADRGCTVDADCHFCLNSFEAPECCDLGTCSSGELCRIRTCGSGCTIDDTCDTTQTCLGLGTTSIAIAGVGSSPVTRADYLLLYDFGRYLNGLGDEAVQLRRWTGQWTSLTTLQLWDQGPGIPERPPLFVFEVEVPWDEFGCSNWTEQDGCGPNPTAASCGCPDFGPGEKFSFTFVATRGNMTLNFTPWGGIEDVASESIAGTTTLSADNCPGTGIGSTLCEIDDESMDAFHPIQILRPAGTVSGLRLFNDGSGANPPLTLRWNLSCSLVDTDYAVYEGSLAALPSFDHEDVLCSTAGDETAAVNSQPGNRYYVVVPTDGATEGSFGTDSSGAQRPPANTPCRVQAPTIACP
ncbi:MAG: hypothetical protein OEM62_03350 [Acidobacteriota bacterium]|nr:hypothetical protein [Acidobacteriota bacterium]